MLKFLTNPTRSIIGVDIATNAVKMLELSVSKAQVCVERYGCEPFDSKALNGQDILNIDSVSQAIKKIQDRCQFSTKKVALAASDSSVIMRLVPMRKDLSEVQMEELVMIEADKFIPHSLNDIHLDFEVQGFSASHQEMLDVLIVACRSEPVRHQIECMSRAGFEVQVIDVESFAVERIALLLIQELPDALHSKTIAIIDIRNQYTHLFMFQDKQLIFTREEQFGESPLIQIMSYNIPFEESQKLRHQHKTQSGLTELYRQRLLLQIRRTLNQYYARSRGDSIDLILLSGALAEFKDLTAWIQAQLGIPIQWINPFSPMNIHKRIDKTTLEKDAPTLLVACGLALRHLN